MRPSLVVAAAAVLASSLLACSTSSSAGSGGGTLATTIPPQQPEVEPPSSVTLQPDVVVIHGGASVMKGISADHGVWTLDKSAPGVSSLAPGKVALILGLDCARVTAVQDNGSTLDVTVAPVSFTDVLQEGSLDWQNATLDTTQGYIGQLPYALVAGAEASPDGGADAGAAGDAGCGAAGDAGGDGGEGGLPCMGLQPGLHTLGFGANPTNALTLSIGNWSISWSAATSGPAVDITGTATWQPNSGNTRQPYDPAQTLGGVSATFTFSVHVQNVQGSSGSIAVHGGTVTNASLSAPIGGSADLSAQASTPTGSQFPASAMLKLPLSVEFPVPMPWGLPVYISVQANLSIQPSLSVKNSVIGLSDHVDFSGSAGITFSGGTATATATPSITTPANPLDNATAPPSIGTSAMIIALQAPRVGIGVGTMYFGLGAKAGVFVDMVNVLTLTAASSTALVPCRAATWDVASHGGGEMTIAVLGTTANYSHQIDLKTASGPAWYTPMVAACKP